MLRFILVVTVVVLFLIFSIPILIIEWIIGKFNKDLKARSSLKIVQAVFRLVLFITGVKVTVIGQENIPRDEAVLYVGNHQSFFDILLTYTRVTGLTGYVAKKEMLKIPLLSHWMKYLHCLFLDRKDLKEGLKTILIGIDKIKSGISMCIFPEGTRNKNGDGVTAPFKEGSLKMAEKTGCAIIPMAMNNTSEIFENHFPKIKPCHIILEYGKPIYPKELEKEERKFLGSYTHKIIQAMVDKNAPLV
jgi:1-acyl-sn-glycerol-3-phosphate acyltransferases